MTENAAWKQNIFVKDYLLPSLSSLSRTTIHRTWKWERRKLQATYSFPCWRWFSFCQTVERKKSESHFTRDSERNVERHELINPSWCCQLYSIKKPDFFSIMVDESSDVSNREQVVFCVPWVDEDLLSLEDFIGHTKWKRRMQQRWSVLLKTSFWSSAEIRQNCVASATMVAGQWWGIRRK